MVQLDSEGFPIVDEYDNAIPLHYDAILFYVDYNRERDSALVEVKDEYCEVFADEKGEPIQFEFEDGTWWVAEQVVYNLGKVLCKDVHDKNNGTSNFTIFLIPPNMPKSVRHIPSELCCKVRSFMWCLRMIFFTPLPMYALSACSSCPSSLSSTSSLVGFES